MTETSLLPFYSADATTKLARALSQCKGKHFLSCQINETLILDFKLHFVRLQSLRLGIVKMNFASALGLSVYFRSLRHYFLSLNRLNGICKILNSPSCLEQCTIIRETLFNGKT